jgi:uncharacterized protein YoaH (UPF0181 family)
MEQNLVNLTHEQTQQAAAAGVQLLQTPGAVSIPSPMAISGVIGTLNALLTAIANGQVVVVNVPAKKEEGDGDGEKKSGIVPIEGGKKAEK